MKDKKDRRIYDRLDNIVSVKYKIKGRLDKSSSMPRNVGGGGIRLALHERLPLGAQVDLEISVPNNPQPITALGKVVWVETFNIKNGEEITYYETGIQFIKVSPLAIGRIYAYFHENRQK